MRIKLLEAMVRGKAIVTTSIGAEGLKNSPGITVVNEPQAFAAAIQHLVDDQAFRMAQGAAAQAHARATFAGRRCSRVFACFVSCLWNPSPA